MSACTPTPESHCDGPAARGRRAGGAGVPRVAGIGRKVTPGPHLWLYGSNVRTLQNLPLWVMQQPQQQVYMAQSAVQQPVVTVQYGAVPHRPTQEEQIVQNVVAGAAHAAEVGAEVAVATAKVGAQAAHDAAEIASKTAPVVGSALAGAAKGAWKAGAAGYKAVAEANQQRRQQQMIGTTTTVTSMGPNGVQQQVYSGVTPAHTTPAQEAADSAALAGVTIGSALMGGLRGAAQGAGKAFEKLNEAEQHRQRQQAQTGMETVQVAVPPGVAAGAQFPMLAPNGAQFMVTVPPGSSPGQMIPVMIPAAANAAAAGNGGAMAPSAPRGSFQVQVPAGLAAGMQFTATSPSGQHVTVQVPPGVGPGQLLLIQAP